MLRSDIGIAVDGVMTQNSQYLPFFRLDPLNTEHVNATKEMRSLLTNGQPDRPLLISAGRFRGVCISMSPATVITTIVAVAVIHTSPQPRTGMFVVLPGEASPSPRQRLQGGQCTWTLCRHPGGRLHAGHRRQRQRR